jgi:hypothetical protein
VGLNTTNLLISGTKDINNGQTRWPIAPQRTHMIIKVTTVHMNAVTNKQHCLFIYLFSQAYCPYATSGYERPIPYLLIDTNIHSDIQVEPQKLFSLILYIELY